MINSLFSDKHSAVIARASSWTISLLRFQLSDQFSTPLFIITKTYQYKRESELYYFSPIAQRAFQRFIAEYQRETGELYVLQIMEV